MFLKISSDRWDSNSTTRHYHDYFCDLVSTLRFRFTAHFNYTASSAFYQKKYFYSVANKPIKVDLSAVERSISASFLTNSYPASFKTVFKSKKQLVVLSQ